MEPILYTITRIALFLFPALQVIAIVVGVIFAISGFTDLGFDLYFIARSIRRFFLSRNWPKLTLKRLQAREQQKIAIFIACWHEADVIAHTLTNAVEKLQYHNYDIFIGTYPNDPETQAEVDKVARKYSHVHKVITPDPGPTNKPSNLNYTFQALKEYEKQTHQHYEIIMTHDSEDVIHPYSLLVINYLIPRKDMVQLPVFPLEVPLREFTHWAYADEFAENHTKLMLVREITGGFVPAAGVGVAFTRRAFEWFNLEQKQIFSTDSLTEDYELGLRMNLEGFRAAFVLVNLPTPGKKKRSSSDWVATRAYFPRDFWRAVRQKTRWNIGIVLQAWQNVGWKGSPAIRWNLFQDRKALVATPANFMAYFVFIYFILYQLLQYFYSQYMPPLIVKGTLLWYLVVLATIFMIWRSINRAYAVNKIYGFWPAVVSVPRVVWGNIINFFAIVRAVVQFAKGRLSGKKLVWDKTAHQVPMMDMDEETEEQELAADSDNPKVKLDPKVMKGKIKTAIADFMESIQSKNEDDRVDAIHAIDRESGLILYPSLAKLIKDPSWRIRAEVCRTLSFLCFSQALPLLENAAKDPDWTVRSNAVRAIGKLGDLGEYSLLRIIREEDRFAREAALAVLEHQGFLERNLQRLSDSDRDEVKRGIAFLQILDKNGDSRLARAALENFQKESEASKSAMVIS
jgi:bacteriophage N4 adsorption protein B